MKLKFKIAKLEDVEEAYRALYSKGEDGSYYLDVDGAVAKDKLDEFRNSNIELLKKMDQVKDIDPVLFKKLKEEHDKLGEKKLIEEGKVDELIAQRVKAMQAEHEKEINALKTELGTSTRQLETLIIDNSVREQAVKLGVAATATEDVLLRAKTVFKIENGQAVAKDAAGNTIYGKDGQNSMGIGDWIGGLKEQAPHLFGPSQGSGSSTKGNLGQSGQKLTPAQKISAGMQSGNSIAIQG